MLTIPPDLRPLVASLQQQVLEANLEIVKYGLVLFTFGNASGILRPADGSAPIVVIKPSGVDYAKLRPEHMVICDLHGDLAPDSLRPSSDLHHPTSTSTAGSQPSAASSTPTPSTPPPGPRPAARFRPSAPLTPTTSMAPSPSPNPSKPTRSRANTSSTPASPSPAALRGLDPLAIPSVLVHGHAPFCWGRTVHDAAHNAIVLENVAQLAMNTVLLTPNAPPVSQHLLDRHHFRKHGPDATYGQPKL